ncbi:probable glutamate carboxypeptidase PLA3 [Lolium rigidum]|uniref:probable glutamate carboxypeptidase PLA3 n=1 Tax=Lolium rigidum TaxID=89674 RepID=UPI001F5D577E|nr:probable glutamate carboxypeptidase PLA3 [Lolium rigidum]
MASKVDLRGTKDAMGNTALHYSASRGCLESRRFLVEESGIDVNAVSKTGATPMSFAAREGNVQVMRYLLDHGGDPVMPDEMGSMAGFVEKKMKNTERAKKLGRDETTPPSTGTEAETGIAAEGPPPGAHHNGQVRRSLSSVSAKHPRGTCGGRRAAARGAAAVLIAGRGDGGVERGTVILGGPGDPLTPGWAATDGAQRLGFDDEIVKRRFPTIPSMPVSADTASAIVRTLGGPALPPEWRAALNLGDHVGGVGPGPTLLNFTYQEDRKMATIKDIFSIIKGYEEPDRYVILGNHRDAWTYGAVDPNSGTAALLDVARRLGIMLQSGWTPRRTIIICSWDAEEFGMIGSTEWVEENLGDLHSKAVAYLNVDCAVQGMGLFAGSTPQLDKLLVEVTRQVKDPDVEGKTVHDTWIAMNGGISIERLARTDSDFAPFLHHAGIPCVDLYYGKEFPGYHTALDSYVWMENHGDPLFLRHLAITEIWGLLVLRLADDLVLPFDYQTYASQLQEHANVFAAMMNNSRPVNFINGLIKDLSGAAMDVQKEAKELNQLDMHDGYGLMRRRLLNDRLLLAERSFLQAEGLQGRAWYKHLLYSPPEDYESELSFFPGIADAISRSGNHSAKQRQAAVRQEMWRVAMAIQRAASVLRGEFSSHDKPLSFTVSLDP